MTIKDYKVRLTNDNRDEEGFGYVYFGFEWVNGREDELSIFINKEVESNPISGAGVVFTPNFHNSKLPRTAYDISMVRMVRSATGSVRYAKNSDKFRLQGSGRYRYRKDYLLSDTQQGHVNGVLKQALKLIPNWPDAAAWDRNHRHESAKKAYDRARYIYLQAERALTDILDEYAREGAASP